MLTRFSRQCYKPLKLTGTSFNLYGGDGGGSNSPSRKHRHRIYYRFS